MSAHYLLVEDDDAHAELLELALAENRSTSTVARVKDGEAALAYLRRTGEYHDAPRPDTVLLDLRLPRVSGHEVLASLKRDMDLKSIPVVVLTTSAARGDISRAYADNVNGFVVKPEDFEEFVRFVRDLEGYWGSWNRAPAVE